MNDAPHRFDLRQLARAWLHMAPWLAAAFLVTALLGGPPGIQLLVHAAASAVVVPAATRAAGLRAGRGVFRQAVDRGFTHLTNVLVLVVLAAFAAAVGGTVGGMAAEWLGVTDGGRVADPLALLATIPILWWHWPALVLAHVVPEEAGYRRPDTGAWRGPGYGHARALARRAGRPVCTALILGLLLLWVVFAATTTVPTHPLSLRLPALAASALVFHPLIAWMAAVETRRMLQGPG